MFKKLKQLLIPSDDASLAHRALKSTLWLFLLRHSDQILNVIKLIILARILLPGDFGIFGVATIAISLLESFSQTGFSQALIQKKGDIKEYFDTAWLVQAARGFLLTSLLIIFSKPIALFFGSPELAFIIKIVSLTVFIEGISSVAVVYAAKELQFHKYFFYQITGSIADFAFSIGFAFIFKNYWALIIGFVAGILVKFIVSYIIYPYLPRFSFSWKKAKELIGFGKWIYGSNVIGFFISQGESVLIGKLFGFVSLGFYQMAYKVSSFLNVEIVSGSLFPAYSKVQENTQALKSAYLKTLQLSALVFIPMAGGIFVLAPDFTRVFLGAKWLPIVGALQILIWSSFIWSLSVITGPLLQAIGKPRIETFLDSLRLIVLLILIYPFIKMWGITGAAFAVITGVTISTSGFLFLAARIVDLKIKDFISAFFLPLLSTLLMITAISSVEHFIHVKLILFFVMIFFGMVVYFTLIFIGEKAFKIQSLSLIKETISLLLK